MWWPSATPGQGLGRFPARRVSFANDPLNLLAVDGPRQPAKERRRRRHLAAAEQVLPLRLRARQISVKASYGLWVTRADTTL